MSIRVKLSPEAYRLRRLTQVPLDQVSQTINDRHRGILIQGDPLRIGAFHWFGEQVVFVSGTISGSCIEGKTLCLKEVSVSLILDLEENLPAGRISLEMPYIDILRVIAQSFGLPLKSAKEGETVFLIEEGPWDGGVEIATPNERNVVFLQGSFNPSERRCWHVWAFSIEKYLSWLLIKHRRRPRKEPCLLRSDEVQGWHDRFITRGEWDRKKFENMLNLQLAIRLIWESFGLEWYRHVFRKDPELLSKDYGKHSRSDTVHPLQSALWEGQPEDCLSLVRLGHYLLDFEKEIKIDALGEKLRQLSKPEEFEAACFELCVASQFVRSGSEVEFVRRSGERTPDMRIDSLFSVECKRKSPTVRDLSIPVEMETYLGSIRTNIAEGAAQITHAGLPGLVLVETALNQKTLAGLLPRCQRLMEDAFSSAPLLASVGLVHNGLVHVEEAVILEGSAGFFFSPACPSEINACIRGAFRGELHFENLFDRFPIEREV